MKPEWLAPSTWVQHAPFAFFIVDALRPMRFVELGTHYGFSFMAVCQAVKALQLPTTCVAIDTWQGDEHAGFYKDNVYRAVKGEIAAKYAGFASMMRMTFDEALPSFADGSIDLLHIDGRHFYDDARHDFESWLPKVAANGIVMFHDTQVRDGGFGVYRLWAELAEKYPAFEFHHGHGLGIIAVGTQIPEPLSSLFKTGRDPAVAKSLRTAYTRLGEGLESDAKAGRQQFKTGWRHTAKRRSRQALALVRSLGKAGGSGA